MSEGKGKVNSSTAEELKEEYRLAREEEIKSYYEELGSFLKERKIDLTAEMISSNQGNKVNIFIVDSPQK